MRILVAPNPFKGTLASWEAADAVEAGLRQGGISAEISKLPLADGGEGTAEILYRALGGDKIAVPVKGPFFEPREAQFVLTANGCTAILEMASASGLPLVPEDRRNPMETTTYGTGQLLAAALRRNPSEILAGVGGSATVDGGIGAAIALGVRAYSPDGRLLEGRGKDLLNVSDVDASAVPVPNAEIRIITDVDNPLCGPSGAAAVFGPQKGATPDQVQALDAGLARWASLLERKFGLSLRDERGTGASGGLPVALVAFLKARIVSGASFILDRIRFDEFLRASDLLITGEGRVDASTLHGKAPMEAIRRARKLGVRALFLAGSQGPGAEALLQQGVEAIIPVSATPPANAGDARRLLEAAAARLVPRILHSEGVQSYA